MKTMWGTTWKKESHVGDHMKKRKCENFDVCFQILSRDKVNINRTQEIGSRGQKVHEISRALAPLGGKCLSFVATFQLHTLSLEDLEPTDLRWRLQRAEPWVKWRESRNETLKMRLPSAKPFKTGTQFGTPPKRRWKWSVPSQNAQKWGPANRKTKGLAYKSVQNQSKIKDLEKGCLRRRLQRAFAFR